MIYLELGQLRIFVKLKCTEALLKIGAEHAKEFCLPCISILRSPQLRPHSTLPLAHFHTWVSRQPAVIALVGRNRFAKAQNA